jgi:hypothetical protein
MPNAEGQRCCFLVGGLESPVCIFMLRYGAGLRRLGFEKNLCESAYSPDINLKPKGCGRKCDIEWLR